MADENEKDKIMELLAKKGYDVSKQAAMYLDYFGRDDDEAFVNEFIDWYEGHYQKVVGGGDVLNFFTQRKSWQENYKIAAAKGKKIKKKPESKDR